MAGGFELSVAALDVLGERLGVEVRVFPFEIPHVAQTMADRARIGQTVLRDLEARGLAHRGRPEPEVEDVLRVLARSPGIGMVLAAGSGQTAARVASDGRLAAVAVQHGQMLRFEVLRPAGVVAALLELVPDLKAVPGRSVTFPREEPVARVGAGRHARDEQDETAGSVLEEVRPVLTGDAAHREVARVMMQRPCRGGGMAVGFARDRHGREQRGEPLIWRDTDAGRFTITNTAGSDGRVWSSYAPADRARVAQQITQLWTAVA